MRIKFLCFQGSPIVELEATDFGRVRTETRAGYASLGEQDAHSVVRWTISYSTVGALATGCDKKWRGLAAAHGHGGAHPHRPSCLAVHGDHLSSSLTGRSGELPDVVTLTHDATEQVAAAFEL